MDTIQKHFKSIEKVPVNEKPLDDDGRDGDEMDRISDMPNEILCHILSFLPTKYAVATSILSTKWKNLFCFIPNLRLHLDDSLLLNQQSPSSTNLISFMNFVNRLLNVTLSDVPSINAFCLICQNLSDGLCISNWVSAAIRLNAKRIDLRVRHLKNANALFDSLYGCKIVSLNLFLYFVDHNLECRFNLPNLKILSIQFMKYKESNVLLEGCPMLEYLLVYNCYCYPGDILRICIPSLKVLKLVNDFYCLEGKIELEAPKLEELNYRGFLSNRYLAKNLKCLQIAQLDLDQSITQYPFEFNEHASELIKVCSNVVKLFLSEKFIIMLQLLPHRLPRFPNLVTLAVKNMNSSGWELLPSLLECAPNLKNLLIKDGFDMECFENFKDSLPESLSINLSQRGEKGFLLEICREARTIEPDKIHGESCLIGKNKESISQ
ncbi:F-box/LRR-repeat protein At4g14103-like isoform X1 [Primulina huaijiensis]|uniref:F-box/LRR-repeat protein At4g14103-like isoform X1 n=1 Tax=Primulina huaijiensis TaxID=1492673 RepID=UPI003CC71BBE